METEFIIPGEYYDQRKKIFGMVRKSFKLKMVDHSGKSLYIWFVKNHTVTAEYKRNEYGHLDNAVIKYSGTGQGNLLKVIRELFGEHEV